MTDKIPTFADMAEPYVDIHTHRPTGRHIELRTAGIHPWMADAQDAASLLPLPEGVQAIGEIGLDLLRGPSPERQTETFRQQLAIAEREELPVVLHCVRAFEPVMQLLAGYRLPAVIFHGFIGSPEQARQALAEGYCLSFGERTFRSPRSMEALRATPSGQLFLETDDSPVPIGEIYARAAGLRGESVAELQRTTTENYERIFIYGQLA